MNGIWRYQALYRFRTRRLASSLFTDRTGRTCCKVRFAASRPADILQCFQTTNKKIGLQSVFGCLQRNCTPNQSVNRLINAHLHCDFFQVSSSFCYLFSFFLIHLNYIMLSSFFVIWQFMRKILTIRTTHIRINSSRWQVNETSHIHKHMVQVKHCRFVPNHFRISKMMAIPEDVWMIRKWFALENRMKNNFRDFCFNNSKLKAKKINYLKFSVNFLYFFYCNETARVSFVPIVTSPKCHISFSIVT